MGVLGWSSGVREERETRSLVDDPGKDNDEPYKRRTPPTRVPQL